MAEKRPDETIPDLEHYLLGEARIIRGAINAAGYQAYVSLILSSDGSATATTRKSRLPRRNIAKRSLSLNPKLKLRRC